MRVDEIEFRTEHPVPFCHPISQPGLSASLLTLGDITIMGFFTTFIHKMLFVIAFATYVIAANVGPRHGSPAIEQAWPDDSDRILTMNFNEHEDYKNLSHEYDHMWDDLLPLNGGFLRKRYSNGQIHGHGISMFHQLHCLQIMRAAYQEMEEKVEGMRKERREVQEEKPHMHMHLGKGHWLHCFDYLRQVSAFVDAAST